MDPLSLAAIGGLIYAGRCLSTKENYEQKVPEQLPFFGNNINTPDQGAAQDQLDIRTGAYILPPQSQRQKEAVPSFADVSPASGRFVHGQPVYMVIRPGSARPGPWNSPQWSLRPARRLIRC